MSVTAPSRSPRLRRFRVDVGTIITVVVLFQSLLLVAIGYWGSQRLVSTIGESAQRADHLRIDRLPMDDVLRLDVLGLAILDLVEALRARGAAQNGENGKEHRERAARQHVTPRSKRCIFWLMITKFARRCSSNIAAAVDANVRIH